MEAALESVPAATSTRGNAERCLERLCIMRLHGLEFGYAKKVIESSVGMDIVGLFMGEDRIYFSHVYSTE